MVLVSLAAAAAALVAQNANAPTVAYMSGTDLAAALAKGGPALTPRAAMISRGSDHLVAGGRRDAPGEAEMHEKAYDIVHVTEGEAVYVTGGQLKGARQTGPGEMLGGVIEGGLERVLRKGDTIVVPPGVPHWWKDTRGVSYLIIKVIQP
jgi:mannose-6-phosphate isomerase-like protein (cupin superfamily)